jgi:NAD(P)-dependent dehydrogenase (short-subunit alcohol dehydrogenase family)
MNILYPDLKSKTIIITGGLGFLGTQFLKAFEDNSSNVIILDKKLSDKKNFLKCDITNEIEIINTKHLIKKKYKKIDVLINNAANNYDPGYSSAKIRLENFSEEIWDKDLNIGLKGAMLCTKIFGSEMNLQSEGGSIINISSDLGIISPENRIYRINFVKPVSYSVVKHGIIGLTRYTATYWANKNIRCNAIAPGGIINNQSKSFLKKISQLIPLGRLAYKNEYEASILYLISDASSYMNGAVLTIDGGRTAL